MAKTVVITQSNYIPWRGYFDLLRSADEVVLLDSVQYTRRDWRNRNLIKTPNGTEWLTIPVEVRGRFEQSIDETRIADVDWAAKHIRAIELAYARAAHFDAVSPWLFDLLRGVAREPLLTNVNEKLLRAFCSYLSITVPIRRDHEVSERGALRRMEPNERLIAILKAVRATRYLTGPSARAYLDVDLFTAEGIEVDWITYDRYPAYSQLWSDFEPHVSIIDLILNVGADAPRYLQRSAR